MIALIVLSVMLNIFLCFKVYRSNALHKILVLSIMFYLMLWMILPGAISVVIYLDLVGGRYTPSMISDNYVMLFSLESIVYFCAFAGMLYLSKIKKPKNTVTKLINEERINYKVISYFLLGFVMFTVFNYVQNSETGYLERNYASAYDQNRAHVLFDIIYSFLEAIIIYAAITIRGKKPLVALLLAALFSAALITTLQGGRIAMLLPIFVLLTRIRVKSNIFSNNLLKTTIFSVIFAVVAMPIAVSVQNLRGESGIDANALINNINLKGSFENTIDVLFTKFDRFSTGVRLIDGYGVGAAGLQPYIGSALIFLPRFIFPNRPVAGSIDGTIYGTPPRLVPMLNREVSDSKNVGVSPLAISVWQFGWLFGASLLIITSAIYLYILQSLLMRRHIGYKIIAISAINIPTFMGIFNSPDVLLKNSIQIAAFYVALLIVLSLVASNKTKKNSLVLR